MLREFIKCKSAEERLDFIVTSNEESWTESELNSVMEIIGVKGNYNEASKKDKLSVIATTLGFVRNAENKDALFTNIDEIDTAKFTLDYEKNLMGLREYTKALSGIYATKTC